MPINGHGVSSRTSQLVRDPQRRHAGGVTPGASMTHGIGEPAIPVMVCGQCLLVTGRAECIHNRVRVLEPEEAAAELGLIAVVDDHRVVSSGAAEVTAPGHLTVGEGAWIDEDWPAADTQRECQRVGVTVGGNRQVAQRTRVGDDTDLTWGLEILSQNKIAAFGKGPTYREGLRGVDAGEVTLRVIS